MYRLILSDKLYIPVKLYNNLSPILRVWIKSKFKKKIIDPTICVAYSRSIPCKKIQEKGRKACYSCKEAVRVIKCYKKSKKWFSIDRGDIELINTVVRKIKNHKDIAKISFCCPGEVKPVDLWSSMGFFVRKDNPFVKSGELKSTNESFAGNGLSGWEGKGLMIDIICGLVFPL